MKISTKGRYALRVMLDLAQQDPEMFIPLKDISQRQEISLKYLEQVIALLNRAGYIQSLRGKGGGYRLSRRPQEYTVGGILRAAEGSLAPVSCLETEKNFCKRCGECETLPFWQEFYDMVNSFLDGKTLADMLPGKLDGSAEYKKP